MQRMIFAAASVDDTDRLGRCLAKLLPDGSTVALLGTLGAGKTRLVQSAAAGAGVPPEAVTSPTFMLCQEYHGDRTIYHLDAYRLRSDEEFLDLGAEEYFASAAIVFIEWADRVRDCLPQERLEIEIQVTGETARQFTITAFGQRLNKFVPAVGECLGLRTEIDGT